MVQTPNLVTGQVVKQPETDLIIAAIRAWSTLVKDLLLAQLNAVVPGGFALSAATGTPIKVNYAQGVVILSGYDIAVPAGSLTLAAADPTYHRYDLLTIAYSQTSPADSAGQPTTLDTATPTVVEGAASATPVLPNLPAGSVSIGWVDVPPGVTTASQCTITPLLGPLAPNNLQDLTRHLAATFSVTSALHGYLVSAPGALGVGRLLVGDAVVGAAGGALTVVDSVGVAHPVAQSGQHPLGYVAVYDNVTGQVEDSKLLGGLGPSGYDAAGSANAVQANLNGHAGSSPKTTSGVHNFNYDCGVFTPSATDTTVNFNFTWPVAPTAVWVGCAWGAPAPGAFPTGFCKGTPGTTSFVAHVDTTGVPYMWIAVR